MVMGGYPIHSGGFLGFWIVCSPPNGGMFRICSAVFGLCLTLFNRGKLLQSFDLVTSVPAAK